MLDAYLEVLEDGYFELQVAFEGLADENVWKRPAEGLLSVGEITGHIAYWEALRLAGGIKDEDTSKCHVKSVLMDPRFRYYSTTLATSPSPEHLAMTAEQVCKEILRVHKEVLAFFRAWNPDLDSAVSDDAPDFTYRVWLRYVVFHLSYHVGQIYTVRHLLGEETPDN